MKPKKLVRTGLKSILKPEELEIIKDQEELNKLYALKIQEELAEVQASKHGDINEFADLMEVVVSFAEANGFDAMKMAQASIAKVNKSGRYTNLALINLNPKNPSNRLYFN